MNASFCLKQGLQIAVIYFLDDFLTAYQIGANFRRVYISWINNLIGCNSQVVFVNEPVLIILIIYYTDDYHYGGKPEILGIFCNS